MSATDGEKSDRKFIWINSGNASVLLGIISCGISVASSYGPEFSKSLSWLVLSLFLSHALLITLKERARSERELIAEKNETEKNLRDENAKLELSREKFRVENESLKIKLHESSSSLTRVRDELAFSNESLSKSLERTHEMAGWLRDANAEFLCLIERDSSKADALSHLFEATEGLLNKVREELVVHFRRKGFKVGGDISVAVKLIFTSSSHKAVLRCENPWYEDSNIRENDPLLITIARDSRTIGHGRAHKSQAREVREAVYSVRANSAFDYIDHTRKDRYAKDDLSSQGEEYINKNPLWNKFYNATIAIPIRYLGNDSGIYKLFGFFCVDSMNPYRENLFEKSEDVFNIVARAADMYCQNLMFLKMNAQIKTVLEPQIRLAIVPSVYRIGQNPETRSDSDDAQEGTADRLELPS